MAFFKKMKLESDLLSTPVQLGFLNVLRSELVTRKYKDNQYDSIRFTVKRRMTDTNMANAQIDVRVFEKGHGMGYGVRLSPGELLWFGDKMREMFKRQKTGVKEGKNENNRQLQLNFLRSEKALHFKYFSFEVTPDQEPTDPAAKKKVHKLCVGNHLAQRFIGKMDEILNLFKFVEHYDTMFTEDMVDKQFRTYLAVALVSLKKLNFADIDYSSLSVDQLKTMIKDMFIQNDESLDYFKRILYFFGFADSGYPSTVCPEAAELSQCVIMLKDEEHEASFKELAQAIFTVIDNAVMVDDREEDEEWRLINKKVMVPEVAQLTLGQKLINSVNGKL